MTVNPIGYDASALVKDEGLVDLVIRQFLVAAAIGSGILLGGAALGQDGNDSETDQVSAAPPDEEIIVRGRSRAALRVQIERAEEAMFDRFNAINSDDEFDIHCRREPVTGSKMLRRICVPNFWRDAEADIGRETLIRLQGGIAGNPQAMVGTQHAKRVLLIEEMRKLIAEDPELFESLRRLDRLQQAYGSGNRD